MPDIHYYVVRQGEAEERFVPMIPVDQLPDWLDVVGVPRELPAKDAAKMTALLDLGRRSGLGGTFQVRLLMDPPDEASSELDAGTGHAARSAPSQTSDEACDREHDMKLAHTSAEETAHPDPNQEPILSHKTAEDPACWKHADQATTKPVIDKDVPKTTANYEGQSLAKTSPPYIHQDQRKSPHVLPCRYWCKFGRCDFYPRCRFAHIMPLTREGLQAVDLDELPQWYIKKKSGRQYPDKKRNSSAGSQSSSSRDGTPTARSKPHKKPKTTAATASLASPAPSKTHEPQNVVPAASAAAVEVEDLIELI